MTKISETEFRNRITIVNFICIILVIFIHTHNLDEYGIDSGGTGSAALVWWVEYIWGGVTSLAVPFFFLISGYLFFRTFCFTRSCIWKKYKSRIRTILIPYLIWNSIYYLYFVLLTHAPMLSGHINRDAVPLDAVVWLRWLWTDEYYIFWFLKDLIVMIALTPALYLVLKNHKNSVSGWVGFGCLLLWSSGLLGGHVIPGFNIYFVIGAFTGINYKELPLKRSGGRMEFIILALAAADFIIRLCTNMEFNVAEIVLLCLGLWCLTGYMPQRRLPWWMSISFFVYCIHDAILEAVEKVWLLAFGREPIAALTDYVLAPLLTICIVILIAALVRKVTPLWCLLTGGRGGRSTA